MLCTMLKKKLMKIKAPQGTGTGDNMSCITFRTRSKTADAQPTHTMVNTPHNQVPAFYSISNTGHFHHVLQEIILFQVNNNDNLLEIKCQLVHNFQKSEKQWCRIPFYYLYSQVHSDLKC